MLFLQRWRGLQSGSLIKHYSESAIEIGMTRLSAIQLEVEDQKSQIRTLPEFRLTASASAEIQRFLDSVYRQVPPPIESPSESADFIKESRGSVVRGLVEVELALKFELTVLRAKRQSVLTPSTLQRIHDAVIHLEGIQSSLPVDRDTPQALKAVHKEVQFNKERNIQKLNFAIERILAEAKMQVNSLPHKVEVQQHQKHNILQNSINRFQNLYSNHRSGLDLQSVLILVDRAVSVAEVSGSLASLVYSHGLFISRLLKHVLTLLPQANKHELNAFYFNIGQLGPKLRPLGTLRIEIDELLGVACKRAEKYMNDLSPSQIIIMLRALSILKFNGCDELLEVLFERFKHDLEAFKQLQLLAIIRLCGSLYSTKPVDFGPVLESIDLTKLQRFQAENLLWSIPRLPSKPGLAYDSKTRKYVNDLICQFDHFMDTGVKFNAPKVLWLLAAMSCFPGAKFTNRLLQAALRQSYRTPIILSSTLYALTSLQHCPEHFLTDVIDDWRKFSSSYSLHDACSVIYSLNLLGKTQQDHLDLLKQKLRDSDPTKVEAANFTRMGQIYFHSEKVLRLISPLEGKWKEMSLKNRARLMDTEKGQPISEDINTFLSRLGYKIKESVPLHDVFMNIKTAEKNGQTFALEINSSRLKIYGQKVVLRTKLLSREQLLKALNIKVVRIDPELWKTLESDQEKLKYINEIFNPENQSSNLVPRSIEQSLFTSWTDPTIPDLNHLSNDSRGAGDDQPVDEVKSGPGIDDEDQ